MIDRSRFGLNRIMCPTLDMEEFFQLTNELGLNWVELRNDINGGKIIDFYSIQEIRNLAKQYNIQICSINALQRFNNLQEIDKIKEELNYLLTLAKNIYCQAIVLCPMNEENDHRCPEEQYHETIYILKELINVFEDFGIMGYIEPLGFTTSSLSSVVSAMKVMKEVGYKGYKIVYDTFHHTIGPDDLNLLAREYDIQFTGLMHLSSITTEIPLNQYRDEHRNMDFSRDRINNKEQVDFFVNRGYQGVISFEPFTEEIQKLDKKQLKAKVNQAIDYLNLK